MVPNGDPIDYWEKRELAWEKDQNMSLRVTKFYFMKREDCERRKKRAEKWLGVEMQENIICGWEEYSGGSLCDLRVEGAVFSNFYLDDKEKRILCGTRVLRACGASLPTGFINLGLYSSWLEGAVKALGSDSQGNDDMSYPPYPEYSVYDYLPGK